MRNTVRSSLPSLSRNTLSRGTLGVLLSLGSAGFGTPASAGRPPQAELRFKYHVKILRVAGKEEVKSRMTMSFGETGIIKLGATEIRLTPTKNGGSSEMQFEIHDLEKSTLVHHAVVPMIDGESIELRAQMQPTESTVRLAEISLTPLAS